MDKPYRRYEVLLPLRFSDGNSVPDELLAETIPLGILASKKTWQNLSGTSWFCMGTSVY